MLAIDILRAGRGLLETRAGFSRDDELRFLPAMGEGAEGRRGTASTSGSDDG